MITFGLTGGICCGKSSVSYTFQYHDIPMVDADKVARKVVEVGTKGWQLIRAAFGQEYLNEDQTINRTKLGALVFSDRRARADLDAFMLPLITEEAAAQFKRLQEEGHPLAGYDAALIIEMGHADKYRPLVVVACSLETQLSRLMKRNSLTQEEAMARIECQMPTEKKIALADWVIYTDGTIDESIAQTEFFISMFNGESFGP
jgi:dephospho-CoA kinase